jgi:hypothetical protein
VPASEPNGAATPSPGAAATPSPGAAPRAAAPRGQSPAKRAATAASRAEKATTRDTTRSAGTRRGAAHQAVRHNSIELDLPVVGRVDLPPPDHLAWYAALGALTVLEIIEWPVAAVLCVGKALADSHRNKAIEEFGRALDEVA